MEKRDSRLLIPLVLLAAFLRFYRIAAQGLWIDEAFSIWMARLPPGEMLGRLVQIDQHPPLYYALLHLWLYLGEGEGAVRALSALCSTLTVPVIYLLGRRWIGRGAGLLAALLLAVSPFHVRLAQEARMYALLGLAAALALYALARVVSDPHATSLRLGEQVRTALRDRRAGYRVSLRAVETDLAWFGYVLFTAAALYTHNTAVFLPIAANLYVWGLFLVRRFRRFFPLSSPSLSPFLPSSPSPPSPYSRFLRNWLLAQLGVLLLWAPWLPSFAAQCAGVYKEFWLPAPTLGTVAGVVGSFVSDMLPLSPTGVAALAAGCGALAILGLRHLRERPSAAAFLLVVFCTPLAGEWLVSLWRPIFYDRTLIWASFPLTLLLAAGLCRLGRRRITLATLLVLLLANGLSLRAYYTQHRKEEWDDAARVVAEGAAPGDLVLFTATWGQIPFDVYYDRLSAPAVEERGVPVDLFDGGELEPKMALGDVPRLEALIEGRARVWLVYSHDWYTDPLGLVAAVLEQRFDLCAQWDLHGVQVRLYAMPYAICVNRED